MTVMRSGTDLAREFPDIAARLVVTTSEMNTGTTTNAWDVLVSAFGPDEARRMVAAQPGGQVALANMGQS